MGVSIKQFVPVLRRVYESLVECDMDWALTGSLAFYLRGLDVPVHDIDIQTDEHGAFEIERRFTEFVTEPVRFRSSPKIRSFFGKLHVDGVLVEVMGDIENLTPEGMWVPTPAFPSIIEKIQYEDMFIPVLNLEHEYQAYMLLGRMDKAELIHRLMKGTG